MEWVKQSIGYLLQQYASGPIPTLEATNIQKEKIHTQTIYNRPLRLRYKS